MENTLEMYETNRIPISARSFLVNIKQDADGRFYGTISHMFYEYDEAFCGLDTAILKMDNMLNDIGSVQASTKLRDFNSKENRKKKSKVTNLSQKVKNEAEKKNSPKEQYRTTEELMKMTQGQLNYFIIDIMYRQNSSWQGNITWRNSSKRPRREMFRSVLELLKLIQSSFDNKKLQTEE